MKQCAAAIAVVLLGVSAVAARQSTAPQAPPTFRSSVDLVHLDVSVLDSQRRPVRGLKPSDFTILDEGQPQQVAVFQAVDIPLEPPPKTPWVRSVAPDVQSNAGLQERRLFLLIMDDAAMQSNPSAANNGREIARRFVDRLGSSDLAAVIFTRNSRHAQDYTSDRRRLLRAVEAFSIGFRDMAPATLRITDDIYFRFSADTLLSAVKVLATMPDRRKSIVYVGQGLPFDPGTLGPAALGLSGDGSASAAARRSSNSQILSPLLEAFKEARRANVSIYTLDVCGLRAPAASLSSVAPTCLPGLEVEYLQALAENTGGRAVINTNAFAPGVEAIFEENASYYLLGFQPAERREGRFRPLEVRVNRPGVQVRTRSGYTPEKASDLARRKAALTVAPLQAALAGVIPKSDLPLRVTAVPFHVPGAKEAMVAVALGIRQPVRATTQRSEEKVDVQVSAFDVNRKLRGARTLKAAVTMRERATGLAEYEVIGRIDLKPGRYQLRVAASVASLFTSGSIYCDLDVPDFTVDGLSMTGVVLASDPPAASAPADALSGQIPVVPTTRREFAPTDRVRAFVRMYHGGPLPPVAVPLALRIVNDAGVVVRDSSHTVGRERFTGGGTASLLVDVPIAGLPRGEYLLSFDAAAGRTTLRREVRFRVL